MRTAEETVLMAALEDDHDAVLKLLTGFLPGERRSLERACRMIGDVIRFEIPEEARIAWGESLPPEVSEP